MIPHARNTLQLTALALVFAGCTSYAPQAQDTRATVESGTYQAARDSGMITKTNPENPADCPAGSTHMDGASFCVKSTTVTDELKIEKQQNGDLAFDVWINAFNGHSCSASGVAEQTEKTNVWRFEKEENGTMCRVDFTAADGAITLEQDRKAGSDCSAYCGSRAAMGGTFPLSGLQK